MSEIRVNRVINAAGADAPNFPYGFSVAAGYGITGGGNVVGTAATFSGAVNIDATTDSTSVTTGALIVDGGLGVAKNVYIGAGLSVAGTLTYEDVTNVDSVGVVTARSGLVVGSAVTIGSAGVSTFSKDVTFLGVSGSAGSITFDQSADDLIFGDSAKIQLGTDSDMAIYHSGSHGYLTNTTGDVYIQTDNNFKVEAADGGNDIIHGVADGACEIHYNGGVKLKTSNDGAITTGIHTCTAGLDTVGLLRESFNTVANKLSAGTNVDLEQGMVHYYSTNETTTATPNIRFNSSKALNNMMSDGDVVTVTIIYKPNGAGYYAALTVDGSGVTEEWNGGSAPSSANAGGYDILTHTLLKTGSGSFLCFSNVQNYA